MDPTVKSIGLLSGLKIPKFILDEVNLVSDGLSFKHTWKKNDLIMINNHRYMNGRTKVIKNDKIEILNLQIFIQNFLKILFLVRILINKFNFFYLTFLIVL